VNLAGQSFSNSVELILMMLGFMKPHDLCKMALVCQQWRILSEDHLLWREFVRKDNFPENCNRTGSLPKWAISWKEVWVWYHQCKSRVFLEEELKNGRGTFFWTSNGSKYEGEWLDNKEHGRGTKFWPDGASYEGEWKDSKCAGHGKHRWASGSTYEGFWVNHKRNGMGKNTWVQNDKYEGQWADDQKDGYGVYIWNDGRTYDGMWSADKRSGFGRFIWPSLGCKYEGQWKNDNREGFGKFQWKDGDIFEGEWIQGKRFGKGRLITSNGHIYEQNWTEISEFDASNKGDLSTPAVEFKDSIFKDGSAASEYNGSASLSEQGLSIPKRKLSVDDTIFVISSYRDELKKRKT